MLRSHRSLKAMVAATSVVAILTISGIGLSGVLRPTPKNPSPATEKAAVLHGLLSAQRLNQAAEARRKRPLPGRPPSEPGPRPPEGIITVSVPFPSSIYGLGPTGWQSVDGARITTGYAGAEGRDAAQGLIVVLVRPLHPNPAKSINAPTSSRTYVVRTRARLGPLRIVSASKRVLTLKTASGKRVRFDVPTRRFISATQ